MKWKSLFVLSFSVLAFHSQSQAKFAQPSLAPIGPLLEKTEGFLEKHSDDARTLYLLGRIHYLAFFNRAQEIISGRQFFGSYTFEIPWENGYEPLAMLDNNEDGKLAGMELYGIRAWFDRNGNGMSDSGEVVDLEKIGITGIETAPETGQISNSKGLPMTDGQTHATWDWIPGRNH